MTGAARLALAAALAAVLGGCAAAAGDLATTTFPRRVGPPPCELGAETVSVPVRAREPLAGWFVDGPPGAPTVVLLHGHGETRRQPLSRAEVLVAEGYGVLLVDLPGHGESRAEAVTYGWTERFAASAAVGYVRQRRPGTRVGVVGLSLGAASAALAGPFLDADALVLEGSFGTFESAVRNRVRRVLGPLSPPAEAALVGQIRHRLGVPPDSVRPVAALARASAPTFVMAGADDPFTPPAETRALYDAAPEPKELWLVEGAGHDDLYDAAPEAYRRRLLAFFGAHLRPDPVAAGGAHRPAARADRGGRGPRRSTGSWTRPGRCR